MKKAMVEKCAFAPLRSERFREDFLSIVMCGMRCVDREKESWMSI